MMWLQTYRRRLTSGTTTGATDDLLCQDPRLARSPDEGAPAAGDHAVAARLERGRRPGTRPAVPLVHDELHQLAHQLHGAASAPAIPLQTTALVNEAYLRLIDSSRVRWQNRAHFFAVSAQLMRRILVDVARARKKLKRGGDAIQVSLDEALAVSQSSRAPISSRSMKR